MDSGRYDNIEYDDDWQTVSTVRAEPLNIYDESEYDREDYSQSPEDEIYRGLHRTDGETVKKAKKKTGFQLIIKLQLIACIIIIIAAFGIKSFGGELYNAVNNWYKEEINSSLIIIQTDDNK